jgi:hypothetical protein
MKKILEVRGQQAEDILGMRKSPDLIEQKMSWFEKLLAAGNDVTD